MHTYKDKGETCLMECKSSQLMSESLKLFFSLPQLLRKSETGTYLLSSEIPQTNSVIGSEGRVVPF